jgi:RNA polymerase sigma-70 factor (ECF subfamily)
MHTTSPSLLEQLQRPEEQAAWTRFVHLYSPLLFYWARKAGLQEPDAADLTQEIFAVLVRKLPEFRYDQAGSFRGWLRTVALNRWRDFCRRRARVPERADVDLDALPEPADTFDEEEYRRRLLANALDLLRGEFGAATWKAFQEHGVAGRPAADVARELGLTIGAVYAARCRVLGRLRSYLQGMIE